MVALVSMLYTCVFHLIAAESSSTKLVKPQRKAHAGHPIFVS